MSNVIKEVNRYVKHLLLRKTDLLKSSVLSERKFEEIHIFEEQKGTRYIRGNVYFGIIVFSCLSSTKACLRFPLFVLTGRKKVFIRVPKEMRLISQT